MNEDTRQAAAKARSKVIGHVVGDKMDKTVSVRIERLIRHPVYGKFIRRTTKVLAHDENNECKSGDRVSISECRPVSRHKTWRIESILERAPEQ